MSQGQKKFRMYISMPRGIPNATLTGMNVTNNANREMANTKRNGGNQRSCIEQLKSEVNLLIKAWNEGNKHQEEEHGHEGEVIDVKQSAENNQKTRTVITVGK